MISLNEKKTSKKSLSSLIKSQLQQFSKHFQNNTKVNFHLDMLEKVKLKSSKTIKLLSSHQSLLLLILMIIKVNSIHLKITR